MKVLGLDISTSITGVSIIESSEADPKIVLLDRIEFKDCETFWDKVDLARNYFDGQEFRAASADLNGVFIEESLQSFRTGMSSAATLITLAKFNSLVSYLIRQQTGFNPEYISATSARKLCGIKVQKIPGGKNAKEQTFDWAASGPLREIKWPLKRSGQPKDWSRDATDAYVIARAGLTKIC